MTSVTLIISCLAAVGLGKDKRFVCYDGLPCDNFSHTLPLRPACVEWGSDDSLGFEVVRVIVCPRWVRAVAKQKKIEDDDRLAWDGEREFGLVYPSSSLSELERAR
jgi:hypothetical protein